MQFHLAEMSQGENDYEKALQSLTSTIGNNICEGAKKAELLLSSACIFRVPDELLRLKESAYIPRLIAIGPLHQNDKHLQTPARDIKKSLTNSLLCRLTTGMPDESEDESYKSTVLQECVKEMRDCVDKARKCYAVELDLSDDHMLEMMLVDGCFILELLYGSFDESKYIPKEAKNIPKEEGQEGKRNGASTSSDLSTPLLQASGMTRMQSPLALQLETEVLRLESEIKISSGQKNTDPIWAANTVQHDLLLLENQIPFFVLEKLFRLTVDRIQNNRPRKFSLNDYVFHYFGNILSPEENSTSSGGTTAPTSRGLPGDSTVLRISLDDQMKSSEEDGVLTSNAQRYYHILHKLHEYCVPQTEQTREKGRIEIMPCASELDYASVKFEPVPGKDLFKAEFSDPEGPFRWCQTARFKIPVLEIYENTELLLRNLIAFEQCCPKVSQHFTSYAVLMDMLVNSGRDVQLLERAGVMRNHLGSRADATNLFNNLCKGVVLEEFFFADMCSKATAHSKRSWPKNLAHIRRTYLSSPWSFIAFCVAFIAFGIQVVTFIQSFL